MKSPFREKSAVIKDLAVLNLLRIGDKPPSSKALLFGAGQADDRKTTNEADKNFFEFQFENKAAGGDNRGIYNRFYLGGAGGGGESLRTFTTVDNVAAGTAHGAHISLDFGSTGKVTGLGVAGRNTLHLPNYALSGGTYAPLQAEIWAEGDSADASGTTEYTLIRFVIGGNATGGATVKHFAAFSIPAALVGSGGLIDTDITTHTPYAGLPILINGVKKHLAVID